MENINIQICVIRGIIRYTFAIHRQIEKQLSPIKQCNNKDKAIIRYYRLLSQMTNCLSFLFVDKLITRENDSIKGRDDT